MFNVGFLELVVVLLVAFLVVGPKDLPKVARWIARQLKNIRKFIRDVKKETGWDEFAKEFKDTADDLKKDVENVKQTFREADVTEELRNAAADMKETVDSVRRDVDEAAKAVKSELEGKA